MAKIIVGGGVYEKRELSDETLRNFSGIEIKDSSTYVTDLYKLLLIVKYWWYNLIEFYVILREKKKQVERENKIFSLRPFSFSRKSSLKIYQVYLNLIKLI